MTHSLYSDRVFYHISEICKEYYHISMDEVLDNHREKWLFKIRCIFISLYWMLTGETQKQVADRFHRSEASIYNSSNRAEEFIDEDMDYSHDYNEIKNTLIEELDAYERG